MSTCVCVLSNNGERLMPTIRLGKVRRLLKDGKQKSLSIIPIPYIPHGKKYLKSFKERSSRVFALTKFTSNQLLVSAFLTA